MIFAVCLVISHTALLIQFSTFPVLVFACRNAPGWLSASMSHAAVTELLKDDLSPFHCPKDPEQQQEGEAEVVCE